MSIEISCNKCGKRLRVPDNAVGKKAKCPCGNVVTVAVDTSQKTVLTTPSEIAANIENTRGTNGASANSVDLTGTIIGGFRVIAKLGQGGMGAVWKAHDDNLKRDVALKTLTSDAFATESAYQRFLQEAQSAAKLLSKHTVTVFAAGRDGNMPYMAMEFVEGESVGDILERDKTIPPGKAIDIIKQAALGLSDAQEHGIIHRDIKPDNLMVNRKGVVKVADFGLARITSKDNERLTTTGQIMGTPSFMSPEQAEGKETDFRSDICSLGSTLYNMISGQKPFKGETPIRVIMNVVDGTPTDIAEYVPDINPAVKNLIAKMMAKNPDHRPQTYETLIKELDAVNNSLDTVSIAKSVPSAQAVPSKTAAKSGHTEMLGEETLADNSERTKTVFRDRATMREIKFPFAIVGGIALVVIIGIILAVVFSGGTPSTTQTGDKPKIAVQPVKTTSDMTPIPTPVKTLAIVKHKSKVPSEELTKWAESNLSQRQKEAAKQAGVNVAVEEDLGNGVIMRFVFIPPGNFMMGSPESDRDGQPAERPCHKVNIKEGFYICQTEVTKEQWDAVLGNDPAKQADPKFPIERISWVETKDFIEKLKSKYGLNTRLPSEAEWEYACRADTNTRFYFGDEYNQLDNYGWYEKNSAGAAHPVGLKKPNAWGLSDMHGNIWEWCEDDWQYNYSQAYPDGRAWIAPTKKDVRALRGGAWGIEAIKCRSTSRGGLICNSVDLYIGFRLARNITPEDAVSASVTKTDKSKTVNDMTPEEFMKWAAAKLSKGQKMDAQQKGIPLVIEDDLGKGVKLRFVYIPPGDFLMGSNEQDLEGKQIAFPPHNVSIKKGFYLSVTELTQAQWMIMMENNPSFFKGLNNPVDTVSWSEAKQFITKLNAAGKGIYRLPSEAEWEYACRAGTPTTFFFGDSDSDLGVYAYVKNKDKSGTHPVGEKLPNRWGLFDIYGNVWEWCEDDWKKDYKGAPEDGSAWKTLSPLTFHVKRGGSSDSPATFCNSIYRTSEMPNGSSNFLGIRLVKEIK